MKVMYCYVVGGKQHPACRLGPCLRAAAGMLGGWASSSFPCCSPRGSCPTRSTPTATLSLSPCSHGCPLGPLTCTGQSSFPRRIIGGFCPPSGEGDAFFFSLSYLWKNYCMWSCGDFYPPFLPPPLPIIWLLFFFKASAQLFTPTFSHHPFDACPGVELLVFSRKVAQSFWKTACLSTCSAGSLSPLLSPFQREEGWWIIH